MFGDAPEGLIVQLTMEFSPPPLDLRSLSSRLPNRPWPPSNNSMEPLWTRSTRCW